MRSASIRSIASAATFLLTASVFGSCTLTGPLDGYSGGQAPSDASTGDVFIPCGTPGYADCDQNPDNGCETPTDSDLNNCGQCAKVCTADAGETPSCTSGMCGTGACPGGKADCDNNADNGCETDIASQVTHCGSCAKVCKLADAVAKCASGVCKIDTCNAGFSDCDSKDDTGCETNTATSIQNCGKCKQVCAGGANASPACNQSVCGLACTPGYDDCDKQASNGCEVKTDSDIAHCGKCATACSSTGGTPSCTAGVCKTTCSGKNADCNKDMSDGCEVDLDTDPNNCGACSLPCTRPPLATALCVTGGCDWKCNANAGDCNGSATDGCETNTGTDPKNCGGCGHDCLGTSCAAGKCQSTAISSGLSRPLAIALDSNNVYWTDINDDAILKAPKSGGNPTTLVSFPTGASLATDGTSLFWFTGSAIVKMPVSGGSTTVLVPGQTLVRAIAVDSDSVYWVTEGTWPGGVYNKDGALMKVAMTGGTPTVLASSQNLPVALAVDSNTVFWTNQGTANDGQILKISKTGGTAAIIASGQSTPCGMAINASVLYWVSHCIWDKTQPLGQTLMKASKSSGSAETLVADQDISADIVADDGFVYWSFAGFEPLQATGSVSKVSTSGGDVVVLAASQNHPRGIALDAQRIYWANGGTDASPPPGDGSIMKVAK